MHRHKIAALLLGSALLAAACSDDTKDTASADSAAVTTTVAPGDTTGASDTTTPDTTTPDTTAPSPTMAMYPDGLRGVRYCEVLLIHPGDGGLVGDVWNTMGHSECPQADWEALDAGAIATERSALVAALNGPRYWTLDRIDATVQIDAEVTTFGTIEMFLAATVNLGTAPNQTPYTERQVVRNTVFVFEAGTEVYEITSADGKVYVMQSYSQTIDKTLSADRLAALGDTLQLPAGWTFATRTLTEELSVYDTDGLATVVQDELQNTYQWIDPTAS